MLLNNHNSHDISTTHSHAHMLFYTVCVQNVFIYTILYAYTFDWIYSSQFIGLDGRQEDTWRLHHLSNTDRLNI